MVYKIIGCGEDLFSLQSYFQQASTHIIYGDDK